MSPGDLSNYRFFEGGSFPNSYEGFTFKTDFRAWLRYEHLARYELIEDAEKIAMATNLCYQAIPKGASSAKIVEGLQWFYQCGESERLELLELPERLLEDARRQSKESKRDYDVFWDFKHVWASFKGQFGIDLYRDDLHWWAYVALFGELSGETSINNLKRLRNMKMADVPLQNRQAWRMNQYFSALPSGYGK